MSIRSKVENLEEWAEARRQKRARPSQVTEYSDEELNELIAAECGVPVEEVTDQLLAKLVGPEAARQFGLILPTNIR
jgi:hypothetical protein